jgi:hypothetical protein
VLEITGNAPGFPEHDGKTLIMEIKYTNAEKKLVYKNDGTSKRGAGGGGGTIHNILSTHI